MPPDLRPTRLWIPDPDVRGGLRARVQRGKYT